MCVDGNNEADVFDSLRQVRPMRYTSEHMSLLRSLQVGMWTMGIIRWRLVSLIVSYYHSKNERLMSVKL